jgi:hypothetical protein
MPSVPFTTLGIAEGDIACVTLLSPKTVAAKGSCSSTIEKTMSRNGLVLYKREIYKAISELSTKTHVRTVRSRRASGFWTES